MKNDSIPLPVMPAALRYFTALASAVDSCVRVKARNLPSAACCPAAITPIPASPAPAAAAAMPSTIESR